MEIKAYVGGTPGKDCGGFCKFCYYRSIDYRKLEDLTCRYCPPNQKGCNYSNQLEDVIRDFKCKCYIWILIKNCYGIIF